MCEPLPRRTSNRRFTHTFVSKSIARLPVFALINAYTTFALFARTADYINAFTIYAFFAVTALVNTFSIFALVATVFVALRNALCTIPLLARTARYTFIINALFAVLTFRLTKSVSIACFTLAAITIRIATDAVSVFIQDQSLCTLYAGVVDWIHYSITVAVAVKELPAWCASLTAFAAFLALPDALVLSISVF